jgi:hypothetical protein
LYTSVQAGRLHQGGTLAPGRDACTRGVPVEHEWMPSEQKLL